MKNIKKMFSKFRFAILTIGVLIPIGIIPTPLKSQNSSSKVVKKSLAVPTTGSLAGGLDIFPIDEQPTLASWNFQNVPLSTKTNFQPSFINILTQVSPLTQVNGTNAVGTCSEPYGAIPIQGTEGYPKSSLSIGMGTTGVTDEAEGFGYEFTISPSVGYTVNTHLLRFNLGYDSNLGGSAGYIQPYCRLYVSSDGGTTWTAVSNSVTIGNLSSDFAAQVGDNSGGGYFIAKKEIIISNNTNTRWATYSNPLKFRLVFYEKSSSSLNARRIVISDIKLDGTVMKIAESPQHSVIYENACQPSPQFSAWPANGFHQIWKGSNGNDRIVMSFETGNWVDNPDGHDIDFNTDYIRFAKTDNGGISWDSEFKPNVKLYSDIKSSDLVPRIQLHLSDPNMGILFHYKYLYWTYDKGKTFEGPALFAPTDYPWIFDNRSSYIKLSDTEAINFCTTRRRNPTEGQSTRNRVVISKTTDGYLSYPQMGVMLGEEDMFNDLPDNYSAYSIMPRAVKMSNDGHYVIAARELWRTHKWLSIYETKDDFATSPKLISRQGQDADSGMALIQLKDGRLCMIYGNRQNGPKSMCATFSNDGGHRWTIPVIIRNDGGSWDLGYPIAFELSNGKVWTAYYWHDANKTHQHIAQTIFDPNAQEFLNLPLQPLYQE